MDATLLSRSKCRSYRNLIGMFLGLGLTSRPLREIAERRGYEGSLAVRHDVDHHLERAVLMALLEHEIGVRASYYLLPPGDYHLDENYYGCLAAGRIEHHPALVPTARLLVELGHEVGLHNNFIQTAQQTGRRPEDLLREELDYFRNEGINIVGTASHGSAFAHKYKFINHELFSQGVNNQQSLIREIGDERFRYRLHALDMTDFGLRYEAYNLGASFGLSDTGGEIVLIRHDKVAGTIREVLPCADGDLGDRYRTSSDDGVGLLVHPDHWDFALEGARGADPAGILAALRSKGGRIPPTTPGVRPLGYLKDLLIALKNDERVRFLRYDDLAFPDDPETPPAERCAAEIAAWKEALAAGAHDPDAFHVLIQYNAEDDPGAVMAVRDLHRSLGIPYSLMTFRRWLTPAAGIVETYPLDWAALAQDVASGLASVGYLNNALHLRYGDVTAAARDFDVDIRELRALGLGCATFMPWGRYMPSRDLPDPVFVDWWRICDTAPLWVYNRFGLHWTSHYGDSSLRDALEGRGGDEPLGWFSQRRQTNGRHLMLLHPHHYTARA
jgi:hypothetical protein